MPDSKLETILDDVQWRREIEYRINSLEKDGAVDAERYGSIIRRLDKIEAIMSKLMWLVVAVIVAGVMKFILDGGLNVPTP